MKSILLILLSVIFINSAYSVDYYFYQGKIIDLEKRNDRFAVVIKQTNLSKKSIENEIKGYLDNDTDVKFVINNIYVVTLNEPDENKINNYINRFSQLRDNGNELIKFASPVYYGGSKNVTQIVSDEFVVKLKSNVDKSKLDFLNASKNVLILGKVGSDKGYLLKTYNSNYNNSLDLSNEYFSTGLFEYCEPDFVYPDFCLLHMTPNDTKYPELWHLNNTGQNVESGNSSEGDVNLMGGLPGADMDVNLAWDFTTGSASVEVGVFDTGIDSTHPDLVSNVLTGFNSVTNTYGVANDDGSHGTAVAGLIGAIINNSLGVAGVAGGCKIRSFKIFNSVGSTSNTILARAFDTARVLGTPILSNSWGGGTPNVTLTNAINNCATNGRGGIGVVILFSTGNNGSNTVAYPGYLSSVIGVGASTSFDQKKSPGNGNQFWWGGDYGESMSTGDIECVAPTICPTTDRQGTAGYNTSAGVSGNYYNSFNGTSASCPNAAGVAALILSVNTSQTPVQITDRLLRGCDKIDLFDYSSNKTYGKWNNYTGYGRVNAYNSVRLAAGVDIVPPTINHSIIESHSSTYPTSISAEILDQDGSVIDTTSYKPKVLYRTNKNNTGWSAFDSSNFVSVIGNNYTFKIPGFGWETQIQYYIKAGDLNGNIAKYPKHAPDTTNLCYFAIGSITQVSQIIPSFALASSGVSNSSNIVFPSFKILKAKVKIYLRHTFLNDMNFTLVSPLTNSMLNRKNLYSRSTPSGSTTGITGVTVADSNSLFWRDGTQPYTNGFFKPDYLLNGLNGMDASGNWKILYYDAVGGDGGTADSTIVTLYRTANILSPSASMNNSSDSIAYFPSVSEIDTLDFYLKNSGNSNLTVSGASFSGTYSNKFSLLSALPGSILPNDSGLFRIRINPAAPRPTKSNSAEMDNAENATLDIQTNDPSKPVFKVSLQTDQLLPVELISFNSVVLRNNVELKWSTATENNNSGFDIQRKVTDSDNWFTIGNVRGNGNSNSVNNYSYTDNNLNSGKYNYRLKQIDFNGNFTFYNLENLVSIGIPENFMISQNYPNPFNPSTSINFDLPVDSKVTLKLYDLLGREVYSVFNNEIIQSGFHYTQLNLSSLSSGVYFYRVIASGIDGRVFITSKKMLLMK